MKFWMVVGGAVVLLLAWALWRDHRRPGMSVRGSARSTQDAAMIEVEEHRFRKNSGTWGP